MAGLSFRSVAAAVLVVVPPMVAAQPASTYPDRPVRVVNPSSPGGGADVISRIVMQEVSKSLGQTFIIDNRPGNSGNLACEMLKNGPADGSVLMFGTSATTVAQRVTRKQLQYDVEKDLVAITLAGTVSVAYVVSATIGVRTLPEYIEWLKKNPRKQNFGTTAMGSMTHFFGVLMGQSIGVPLEPVAYKGAAPLISDLSAGHASAGCGGVSDFLTHHRGDKMRIIAISAPKRVNAAPDLPTIAELGHPKLSYEGFYGFYGPSRMSAGLVAAWNKELRTVLDSPDMRQRLLGVGLETESSTPTELFNRQSNLITYMTAMMKAAGVEPE